MKLVEGQTLGELLKAESDLASRRMDLLQVFARVCQALAFAHSAAVIHRDLKPSNVMVGKHGEVMVMDLGVAKVLPEADVLAAEAPLASVPPDETDDLTEPGSVIGTWEYMPPEQANARIEEVGRHSDVFGLGGMLCAILTGKPPYVGPTKPDVIRQARHADLGGAYARLQACGADGELIALARDCLSAGPNDRPEDGSAVEKRLWDYLASVQERLRQAELAEAEEKAEAERRARELAEENEKQAKNARRRMLRLTAGLACALLGLVAMIWLKSLSAGKPPLADLWDEARKEVAAAAEARQRGLRYEAYSHYMQARAKYDKLIAEAPDRLDFHLGRVHVEIQSGSLLVSQREWGEAEKAFTQAGNDLIVLLKHYPADGDCQLAQAEVYHNLGILYDARGKSEHKMKALKYYGDSLRIRQGLHQKALSNRDFQRDLARSYGFMADTQLALGLKEEAKKSYKAAEDLRRSLKQDPNDLEAKCQFARSLGNTGNYLDWIGKPEEAIQAHRARKEYQEELPRDKIPAEFQTDLADCYLAIASLQLDTDALQDETRPLLEKALEFYRGLLETNKGKREKSLESSVAQIHVLLGKYHCLAGNFQRAKEYLQKARDSLRDLTADAALPDDLYNRALAQALLGQLVDGKERKEYALQVQHSLTNAKDKGFLNVARLERDKGFRPFHRESWFQKIVADIHNQRAKARAEAKKLRPAGRAG
jgi:serine/threonine protein kinase